MSFSYYRGAADRAYDADHEQHIRAVSIQACISRGTFMHRSHSFALTIALLGFGVLIVCASQNGGYAWQDPVKHAVQFVTVDQGVKLELLDWGGAGRPVVLLTGSGHTAHVYDEFAPKLIDCCHVYGLTRRGFGASSRPPSGYDDQRLADDVFRALVEAKIQKPVLIGHSMAGGEMTTVARQHSRTTRRTWRPANGEAPSAHAALMSQGRKSSPITLQMIRIL
jgi:hypothetical protein